MSHVNTINKMIESLFLAYRLCFPCRPCGQALYQLFERMFVMYGNSVSLPGCMCACVRVRARACACESANFRNVGGSHSSPLCQCPSNSRPGGRGLNNATRTKEEIGEHLSRILRNIFSTPRVWLWPGTKKSKTKVAKRHI